ncbi:hypothetical protein OPT61_g2874 [Boeremia exigua]|uniref:Uncharacterized protein n=1 Tax=Boeremia exigua TaxID=749465 RepID=A0ACC2IJY3_9PLEO|nr:hypothetical protein OPT61_g2874 [Boeremia exigua]
MIRVALALHGPRHRLPQRLHTAQNPRVMRQIRQIGCVLPHQPVQKLLERLAAELPEEDECVRAAEAAAEPVKYGGGGGGNGDDADKRHFSAQLDVQALIVQQRSDEERAEDAREVGEEGAERARPHGEVRRQPGAHEAVVEVADEESREEQQNAAADEQPPDRLELLPPRRCPLRHNPRPVLPPHFVRRRQAQRNRSPKHIITMNTIYVAADTDPVVLRCAFSPRLIAPPTIGPAAFADCQTAR